MSIYSSSKPKEKKITLADIDQKYWPQWFVEIRNDKNAIIDDNVAANALVAALNNIQNEKNAKPEAD